MKDFIVFIGLFILLTCQACRSHREASSERTCGLLLDTTTEARCGDSTSIDTRQEMEITIEYYRPTEDSAQTAIGLNDLQNRGTVTEASPNTHHGAVRRVTLKTGRESHVTHAAAETRTETRRTEAVTAEAEETEHRKSTARTPYALILTAAAVTALIYLKRKRI